MYLQDLDRSRTVCIKHSKTAAIHDCGEDLQVYRMFSSSTKVAKQLHTAAAALTGWEESIYWPLDRFKWEKLKGEVESRVKRHSKQYEIVSKGVLWEEIPILIHAYKFDCDPRLKIELVAPECGRVLPMLPVRLMASILRCHDFLVPAHIANPGPYYAGHEDRFLTISEYLSLHTPPELYAAKCFPRSASETS